MELLTDPIFWVDFLALTTILFGALWMNERGAKK